MLWTSWHHPLRDLPSPEGAIRPATRDHTPFLPLRQDSAVGYRDAYYAYHLGREVQQHHQRLFESTAQLWSETST
jgi:hypothetical protein